MNENTKQISPSAIMSALHSVRKKTKQLAVCLSNLLYDGGCFVKFVKFFSDQRAKTDVRDVTFFTRYFFPPIFDGLNEYTLLCASKTSSQVLRLRLQLPA
jgi:hypothetical protein